MKYLFIAIVLNTVLWTTPTYTFANICDTLPDNHACPYSSQYIYVESGISIDGGYLEQFDGADIQIVCHHGNAQSIKTGKTDMGPRGYHGIFNALYKKTECDVGDTVVITAQKNSLSGSRTGVIPQSQVLRAGVVLMPSVPVPELTELGYFASTFLSLVVFSFIRHLIK